MQNNERRQTKREQAAVNNARVASLRFSAIPKITADAKRKIGFVNC
jgi:hypothetical protein